MNCGHCSGTVKKVLEEIDGISEISVDLQEKKAAFKVTDTKKIDTAKDAIAKAGFTPSE